MLFEAIGVGVDCGGGGGGGRGGDVVGRVLITAGWSCCGAIWLGG